MHLYPIQKSDFFCDDYIVKINGVQAALDSARVSACPFNRRWPGHQRPVDQSELVNFLSLAYDGEPLHFEIIPKKAFEKAVIRPLSLGFSPEIKDGVISFTVDRPAYFTVEPFGRNGALHIFIDKAVEYVPTGKIIRFEKGVHEAGVITLESNTTLILDEGALVYGGIDATDCENIRIIGNGILDNSHENGTFLFDVEDSANTEAIDNVIRRRTVLLKFCKNVEIDGITIRDSLVYNICPIACENVKIRNVKIIGCWRYNSDGIDMHNSTGVLIENCFIRTFDDSVCVKGWDYVIEEPMERNGKIYNTASDYTVKNCVIWNDWGRALEIGAETRAEEISNVLFTKCDIIHSQNKILDCQNVDYADVHDIEYSDINIEMDDVYMNPALQMSDKEKYVSSANDFVPTFFESVVAYHPEYSYKGDRRGKNRYITVKNIHVYGNQRLTINILGYNNEYKSESVTIKEIYQNGKKLDLPNDIDFTANEFTDKIELK